MAGETIITLVGNLTDDPELRFTPFTTAPTLPRSIGTCRSASSVSTASAPSSTTGQLSRKSQG